MATTTPQVSSEGDKLRQRLAALRRQLRFVATWRGVSYLVALVLAVLLVVGVVDWLYDLYPLVRAVALVGTLAGVGLLTWKQLLVPLSKPMDDLSLALQIEERHPTLNDALASTIQFLDRDRAPDGESAPMRREAVRRTIGRITGLDFNRIVDRKGLRAASMGASLCLVVGLALAYVAPNLAAKAVWRFATPFSSVEWPKKTQIDLDGVVRRIGRGREYRVSGTIRGVIPKEGTLELSLEGMPTTRRSFAIKTDDEGHERFAISMRSEELRGRFRYRLYANDAATDEITVDVLDLPQLVSLNGQPSPQLTLRYPAYTDLPSPARLAPGTGNVDAVLGTYVEYRAATDRPLTRAWIEYQPDVRESLVGLMLSPLAAEGPLGVVTTIALTRPAYEPVPAQLSADRREISVTFRPPIHGHYALHFQDENELVNSKQYELRIKPDPAPVVRLERPSATRDVLSVLSSAELPLQITVEDMEYAVRSVWLEYRTAPDGPTQVLPLYGTGDELGPWVGPAARLMPYHRMRPKRLDIGRLLAMGLIRHPDGSALREGDRVTIQAAGDDFDNVTPGKEPGRSHAVEITIVSRETMRLLLNQEEGRIQTELMKMRDRQKDALNRVAEIENRLRNEQKLTAERDQAKEEVEKSREEAMAEEERERKETDPKEKQKRQEKLAELKERQKEAEKRLRDAERRMARETKLSPEREARRVEQEEQKAKDEAIAEADKADRATDPKEKQKHREKAAELIEKAEKLRKEAAELRRQAAQLAEAMEMQQQVRERVGTEKDGLRSEVDRLRDTLKQNGMENSSAAERMAQVQKELERLAERELERIEPKLAEAKKISDLQDEQVRKERMAELESKAKAAEAEVKAAEEQAKRLEEQAKRAEEAAASSEDAEEKAKREQEAKKSRAEALAQLEKAKEKREQAEAMREEAKRGPDPGKVKQAISDARKGQEEVEKSLSALLQDLEPAGSTREIKRDAGQLLKEQREAMAELDEIEKKEKDNLTGKSPDKLNDEQKAALDAAQEKQKKLAEKAQQMAAKMKRIAEERKDKDPETAQAMKDAADRIDESNLAGKMKEAQEAIQKNKLNEAKQKQREALAELEKLNKELEGKREEELDRLAKKLREAEKKVEELMDEQEKLQKKMREAEKIKDPKKREEELAKLAKKQQELKEKTEDLMKHLSRMRAGRARQALGAAGEEMGEAGKQLSRGEGDDDKQEDVLDRLEETRQELEKARKKAEEELAREQLARVSDVIKRIRERQEGHVEEANRIQKAVQDRKGWGRALGNSMRNLGDNQGGLGEETGSVAKKDLSGAPVFQRLLERASRSMDQAGRRAGEMGTRPPAVDALPDPDLGRHQQDALRRLTQLLDSLKEAAGERQPLGQPGGGGGGDDEGGGGGREDDGLPPMAQLKLLRALQEEVNKKTESFRKRHPNLEELDARAKVELEDLRREQKEVADLLERMTLPPEDRADEDRKGEKKDEKPKDAKEEKK